MCHRGNPQPLMYTITNSVCHKPPQRDLCTESVVTVHRRVAQLARHCKYNNNHDITDDDVIITIIYVRDLHNMT